MPNHPPLQGSSPRWRSGGAALVAALALSSAACATRSVPARHLAPSALAPHGPVGQRFEAPLSLRSDPPLPGEPTGAWTGLEAAPEVRRAP